MPAKKPRAIGLQGISANALVDAAGDHLAFFFAIDQVVVILHRDEARPAVQVGGVLGLGELPGEHGGGADVARLARFDHIVQRFHGLFDGRVVIPAVDLVKVDVIHLAGAAGSVDGVQDVFAREAAVVDVVAHRVEDLGGDHQVLAPGPQVSAAVLPSTSSLAPSE